LAFVSKTIYTVVITGTFRCTHCHDFFDTPQVGFGADAL
jgi:hypothetical protein